MTIITNFQFTIRPFSNNNQDNKILSDDPMIAMPSAFLKIGSRTGNDDRYIQVYASGLPQGNFFIAASLNGFGKKLVKAKSAIIAKEMELFDFSLKEYRIHGTVYVTISIDFIEYPKPIQVIRDCTNCKELEKVHSKILNDSLFSDFKFIVKGKEFKVHRAILAEASPVFNKLFTVDMEEAKNNECIVKDIEPEIFEHLLRFIYKRELPTNLPEVAMKLFETAHYYEIDELKGICLKEVFKLLKISNAVEIFNWACVYECEKLKDKAWIIVKRDVLKITEPLKNEPPTPEMLQKMIEFWAQIF